MARKISFDRFCQFERMLLVLVGLLLSGCNSKSNSTKPEWISPPSAPVATSESGTIRVLPVPDLPESEFLNTGPNVHMVG